jgi:hypothetical protein
VTDLREFRRACHEAARRTGGRIVEFRIADGVTPNFHQGVLDHGGHRVSIVCTRDRAEPVVAIAEPRASDGMGPADLKYWAPADLGEVLFNYWDRRGQHTTLDTPFSGFGK